VLGADYEGWFNSEMARDFTGVSGSEIDDVWLDRKHQRRLDLFVGEGFSPRPRDPATSYPSPAWKPGDSVSATPGRPAPLPTPP
jgi:hypothetical protein